MSYGAEQLVIGQVIGEASFRITRLHYRRGRRREMASKSAGKSRAWMRRQHAIWAAARRERESEERGLRAISEPTELDELPEYSVSQTGQDAEQPAADITIAEAARSLTEEQWNRVRWTMALEDQGVPEIQCSCDGGAYFTEYQNRRRSPFIVNYDCPIHRR